MAKKEAAAQAAAAPKTVTTEAAPSLLDSIVENGRLGKDEAAKTRGRDMVTQFVDQVLQGNEKLESLLSEVLGDDAKMDQLKAELERMKKDKEASNG